MKENRDFNLDLLTLNFWLKKEKGCNCKSVVEFSSLSSFESKSVRADTEDILIWLEKKEKKQMKEQYSFVAFL